jgi:flagellar biogenesis protein FliO
VRLKVGMRDVSMKKNTFLKNGIVRIVWTFLLLFSVPGISFAMPVLKHVEVKSASEFSLVFDGKVEDSQITSEYVNDIFQINLKNVAVYPAKIVPVQGKYFSKVFAYQYSPKLVRCRFTLRGKVADIKRKIKIVAKGAVVTVQVEQLKSESKKTESKKVENNEKAELTAKAEQAADALDEQALLQKVIRGTDPSQAADKAEVRDSQESLESNDKRLSASKDLLGTKTVQDVKKDLEEKTRLGGGKPLPAVWPVIGKLGLVILLIGLFAAIAKKVKTTPFGKNWFKAVSKLAKKRLHKNRDMIQVISTHYLDPKKSLAVVKVAGRLLVLGVSNDAINLITQLPGDGSDADDIDFDSEIYGNGASKISSDALLAQSNFAEDPIFSDFLGTAKNRASPISPSAPSSPSLIPNARSRIKNRLEGLKQL